MNTFFVELLLGFQRSCKSLLDPFKFWLCPSIQIFVWCLSGVCHRPQRGMRGFCLMNQ